MDRFLKQQEQGPRLKNPYFPDHKEEKKAAKRKNWRKIFIISLIVIVVALIVLIPTVFRNSTYNITLAIFTGNTRVPDHVIIQEVNNFLSGNHMLIIPKKNILFLPKNALEDHLIQTFHFEKTSIDSFTKERKIHIQVVEKPLEYIIEIENQVRYLSPDGTILEVISEEEKEQKLEELLTISFLEETLLTDDGDQITQISQEILDVASTIQESFLNLTDIAPKKIELPRQDSQDIKIFTDKGWYVYIDRTGNITRQFEVVKEIIRQKDSAEEQILEYVDVRITDRAFVK